MRPTILVVSPYRVEYGPREVLEHVVAALADGGYRTVVVVPVDAEISDALRGSADRIRHVVDLGTIPRTVNAARLATFLRSHLSVAEEIARVAVEEDAQAVYSISEAIFAGSLAARRAQVKSVVHVIGMSIQSPRVVAHAYIRFLNRFTDRFVACSAAVAEMLGAFGAPDERIVVVHNGISVEAVDAGRALAVDTPTGPAPRIGMVAAYDPRKGHELFVRAAALVVQRHPDARFYLIGGSLGGQPESTAFERRVVDLMRELGIEDCVERVGFVPRPDVYAWIASLDVVVVPSRTEAFAHALLEAMACERAIVASAVEGNLDALVHGHSGLYVPRDAARLADAVSRLVADPGLRETYGRNARHRVEQFFDLPVTRPVIARLVDEIVGAGGDVRAAA